jgi:alkylation response protein AidB-like acyl-CoA dehydrogenase
VRRSLFDATHDLFRAEVRTFIDSEVLPNVEAWRAQGIIDRAYFRRAAEHGLLGLGVPVELGGRGIDDYRYNQVVLEEFELAGVGPCGTGIMLQNDIVIPYLQAFGSEEQQARWIPDICRGELLGALAMTEPTAGSDVAGIATTAVREGDGYRVSGGKIFIGCGMNAGIVLTVVRTDPAQRHRGLSLLVLEADAEGFERVRNIPRAGREEQDVAELAFHDIWVSAENRLGDEGAAFGYLMRNLTRERLQVASSAVAASRHAFDLTLAFVKERQAFGQPVGSFQHNRFVMAEMATELSVAQAYVDGCVTEYLDGALTAEEAAKAKWWCTEMQVQIANRCFQLHGARGYMDDGPITRAWRDARVTTIYAGTTEFM